MEQFHIFRTLDTVPQECSEMEFYKKIHDKNIEMFRDSREYFDWYEKLLRRTVTAQEKFKENKDIDSLIREFEFVFIDSEPPCISKKALDLAKYYERVGKIDKAWNYLNQLVIRNQVTIDRVRFAQAILLRNEQMWEYSIELFMCSLIHKRWWHEGALYQLIKPITKRIRWDDLVIERLEKIVEKQVYAVHPSEKELEKDYQKFHTELTGTNLVDLFK